MSQHKYAEIADTVYFWFALNTTAGEADDGATPTYVIRLAGAASDAAPTSGPTAATLLSEGTYYAGLHEIAYDTTGDAAGEYAVFCTAVVSTVNPAGLCGSYTLRTAGTAALDVNVTSIANDVITPASIDEDADFVIQALSITNALDAGSVLVDGTTTLTGAVGTGAITVASASITGQLDVGNLLVDGTTVLTGTVGTGAMTVASLTSTGAITAGTMSVTGQLDAGSLLIDTTTTLTGAVEFSSTWAVVGISTFTGALNANITGDITGNLSGSVGSLTGHVGQSADNNTILANATYGLAQLVRSTTPANTLDVSATGEAGLDFANIKDATGAHTLTNITVPVVTTNTDLVAAADVKTAIEAAGSHLTLIKAVTDALTATVAAKLAISGGTMVSGSAATGTLSTTEMTTNLTIAVNDQYNGRVLIFAIDTTTAVLRGQATDITDTVTTDGKLTFTALTTAPSNGDTFIIV